jgi:hypothetical protein
MDTDSFDKQRVPQGSQSDGEPRSIHALVTKFLIGDLPNPDDPNPPGPLDPIIRRTLSRIRDRFGPHPDPWINLGLIADRGSLVSLNPQPLPPGGELFAVMLAEEVVNHVSLLEELADVAGSSDNRSSSFIDRFVDDVELCPPYRKWPFPPPKRGETQFDSVDLVIMGVTLQHLAQTVPQEGLAKSIHLAGERLVEKGASRL